MTFTEALSERERRFRYQTALLSSWDAPLISFTVVTPGVNKNTDAAHWAFHIGLQALEACLNAAGMRILHREFATAAIGPCAYYVVPCESLALKRLVVEIEENHPQGRLFDFDVIESEGNRVSRQELGFPPRACLLCARPYFECMRDRSHSVQSLLAARDRILGSSTLSVPVSGSGMHTPTTYQGG